MISGSRAVSGILQAVQHAVSKAFRQFLIFCFLLLRRFGKQGFRIQRREKDPVGGKKILKRQIFSVLQERQCEEHRGAVLGRRNGGFSC